jgi:uncharacterized protein
MNPLPSCLTLQSDAVLLALKVQPRASRNAFAGPIGHELRVTLTAPPVDDAANDALIRFLSDQFSCARRQLEIVRGRSSRHKIIRITGFPVDAIVQLLFSPQSRLRRTPL